MRYSKPVGVLIGYEDYEKLMHSLGNHVEECKACIKDFKITAKK